MLEDKLTAEELLEMNSCMSLVRNSDYQESHQREYIIPGRTEDPTLDYLMLRAWIIDFHELNNMKLPTRFYKRNRKQLTGMFYGMLDQYGITVGQITSGGLL